MYVVIRTPYLTRTILTAAVIQFKKYSSFVKFAHNVLIINKITNDHLTMYLTIYNVIR